MGDGVNTPFDVFVFFLIFVGIPTLIFGLPIVVLGFLSTRRAVQLKRKRQNEASEHTHQASETKAADISERWPWLLALLLLVVTTAIAYLIFAAPISGLFTI